MTWWMQPGWAETRCACGAKIWPEGDPDWGACYSCFSARLEQQQHDEEMAREYDRWCNEQMAAEQEPERGGEV